MEILRLLRRRELRRLRRIMRGYRYLRETNQLGKIAAVKDAMANTRLTRCGLGASKLIFGAGFECAELAVRQYLLVRVASLNLNRSLLHALGTPGSVVVHHLPPEWREVLDRHGFKVAKLRSALAWNTYVAVHLGYGAFIIGWRAIRSVAEIVRPSFPNLGRFAFFHGLARGNLPQSQSSDASHDILSWYLRWPGRISHLDTLSHTVRDVPSLKLQGVSVLSIPSAIQPLASVESLMRFVRWSFGAAGLSIVDFLRGRWWHGLMLNEASSAAVVRHHSAGDLARDYLFHNSAWVFRPLWTYEAAQLGSRISYYFYSTNCENFKQPEGYPLQENFWQVMNWPFYMVWDEYQADFVRRAVGGAANIRVVGPVWFQAGTQETPLLSAGSFAVFDVQPHRASRYQTLGMAQEYFLPETTTRFLVDIHEAIRECGGTMVLKRKRSIGTLLNRGYRKVVDELCASDHFAVIDPETSAVRIIESSAAVISMPFTSTALLGRELGKPSVYYDPRGVVLKDDRAAHGIEVLSGPDELRAWVSSVISSSDPRTVGGRGAESASGNETIDPIQVVPSTDRERSAK